MGRGKKIVCFCHDVTEEDIIEAIEMGYDDIESIKRFTGVTTGPCQGKSCMMHVLRILRRMGKLKEAKTTVIRPPIDPIPIEALLGDDDEEEG